MNKKHVNKICTININKDNVSLIIETEGKNKQYFITFNDKEPRVVSPLPNMDKLIDNAKHFSSHGMCGGTIEGFYEMYLQGRHKDISDEIMEIRKSIKRIERSKQCIDIVKEYRDNQKD